MQNEKWLPIVNWENLYRVSDHGRVHSSNRIIHRRTDGATYPYYGQLLTPTEISSGHLIVTLSGDGHKQPKLVHVLVLESFVGLCPENHESCHKDDNPKNNALPNLYWGTRSDNNYDKVRNGRHHASNRITCPLKHLLAIPNLRQSVSAIGRRGCLACHRTDAAKQRAKQRNQSFDYVATAARYYQEIMANQK